MQHTVTSFETEFTKHYALLWPGNQNCFTQCYEQIRHSFNF